MNKLRLFRILTLVIWSKTYYGRNWEENTWYNHVGHITTQDLLLRLTAENFTARLRQVDIETKAGDWWFHREDRFWWYTKKLNKEVTSIKTKHESDYEKRVRCQKKSNYQRLYFFS